MEFWKVQHPGDAPAAIEARSGREWTYHDLLLDIGQFRDALPRLGRKSLGLLVARNSYECLVAYLAALNEGCALILADTSLDAQLLSDFIATYEPDWVFSERTCLALGEFRESRRGLPGLRERERPQQLEIHADLALLLTTSGSTGSPKLVRLTLGNLAANAASIAQYLQIGSEERPMTSLPMSYSYGLSVINSHLAADACIVLTEYGVLQREFWDALDRYGCTSFAGVPYTYQMLLQTGLLSKRGETLKTLTQAGGRLEDLYTRQMHDLALTRRWKFFVMYGQTEATARISFVPFEKLGEKIGSVGLAIPNGTLSVDAITDEMVYRGPNVMMGYAECRADLAKGDELNGMLRTGDLARMDDDGYFYITGRLKRFLKMFGKRFNLDDVERVVARRCEISIACYGRDDLLMAAVESPANCATVHGVICETFSLPQPAVKVIAIPELPRTPNGKLDYKRLAEVAWQPSVAVS